jgi:hypothetical protein
MGNLNSNYIEQKSSKYCEQCLKNNIYINNKYLYQRDLCDYNIIIQTISQRDNFMFGSRHCVYCKCPNGHLFCFYALEDILVINWINNFKKIKELEEKNHILTLQIQNLNNVLTPLGDNTHLGDNTPLIYNTPLVDNTPLVETE